MVNKSLSVFPCSSFLFPVKSLYNLDEDESQGAIAINLLPLVSQSELGRVTDGMSNQNKRYFDTYLCSHPTVKGIVFIWCTTLLSALPAKVPGKELVREFTSFQCSFPSFAVGHIQIDVEV